MPRPKKCRRICALPRSGVFAPTDSPVKGSVAMTVDEFESIRLIDLLGCTQEEAAERMGVARTTVQATYNAARSKLADTLVHGKRLQISGGDYVLCPRAKDCHGSRHHCAPNAGGKAKSGEQMVKIAVTYDNGQIFQHFGAAEQFKLYNIRDGKAVSSQILSAEGRSHGALAGFLREQGVDTLICGGIGGGARTALEDAGITLYPGVSGEADAQVDALLAGTLQYDPDTLCSHHHEEAEQNHSSRGNNCR